MNMETAGQKGGAAEGPSNKLGDMRLGVNAFIGDRPASGEHQKKTADCRPPQALVANELRRAMLDPDTGIAVGGKCTEAMAHWLGKSFGGSSSVTPASIIGYKDSQAFGTIGNTEPKKFIGVGAMHDEEASKRLYRVAKGLGIKLDPLSLPTGVVLMDFKADNRKGLLSFLSKEPQRINFYMTIRSPVTQQIVGGRRHDIPGTKRVDERTCLVTINMSMSVANATNLITQLKDVGPQKVFEDLMFYPPENSGRPEVDRLLKWVREGMILPYTQTMPEFTKGISEDSWKNMQTDARESLWQEVVRAGLPQRLLTQFCVLNCMGNPDWDRDLESKLKAAQGPK